MPQQRTVYLEGKVISKGEVGTTKTNQPMINFGFAYSEPKQKQGGGIDWNSVVLDGDNRMWAFGKYAHAIAMVSDNQRIGLDCVLTFRDNRLGLRISRVLLFDNKMEQNVTLATKGEKPKEAPKPPPPPEPVDEVDDDPLPF